MKITANSYKPFRTHFHICLLVLITFLGALFRFANLSPFKFYPDAYQSLLVAQNIAYYHSVIGYLGKNGMLYPDNVMWTRPGYPLLILFFDYFIHNMTLSAQIISISAGVASIPLVYFLITKIFKNRYVGLAGSFLFAFSFNHIVWSGFIMTETTGIFFLLLTLVMLFSTIKQPARYAALFDLISGGVFALAVLTRYEYIVLILPIFYLMYVMSDHPTPRIINFTTALLFILALVVNQVMPVVSIAYFTFRQLSHMLIIGSLFLFLFIGLVIVLRYSTWLRSLASKYIFILLLSITYLVSVIIILQIAFHLPFLSKQFTAVRVFFQSDFLLATSFLIGITYVLRQQKYQVLNLFTFLSMLFLAAIYFQTNQEMQRYWTHLLPFILIPASVGFYRTVLLIRKLTIEHRYRFAFILLILVVLLTGFQMYVSMRGMHLWAHGVWFHTSYEEKAAVTATKYIPRNDPLLIASFPEPYYYFTKVPTYSITNSYPFVYIDSGLNNKTVFIIQDMGMDDQFPAFSTFLTRYLQKNQIATFWVGESYHYGPITYAEIKPVTIYTIKLKALKKRIVNYSKLHKM